MIDALITTRILVQFIGQIAGVMLLRRQPGHAAAVSHLALSGAGVVALAGWLFIFLTTNVQVIAFGLGLLLLGVVAFGVWSRHAGRQPLV